MYVYYVLLNIYEWFMCQTLHIKIMELWKYVYISLDNCRARPNGELIHTSHMAIYVNNLST